MGTPAKYELLERQVRREKLIRSLQLFLLGLLCLLSVVALCLTWVVLHRQALRYPSVSLMRLPKSHLEARISNHGVLNKHYDSLWAELQRQDTVPRSVDSSGGQAGVFRLVCYYVFPSKLDGSLSSDELLPKDIDPHLCTHLNVGFIPIVNNSLALAENQKMYLKTQIRDLRLKNRDLKILFWIGGGAFDYGFTDMVKNHKSRKQFIQSIKRDLQEYALDGVDLDWEFPSPYNKDRQHFSQLLHEIRREYQRSHRPYLLSIAMPAPVQYQDALYDIDVINENVDYVNVMAYDYNLYSPSTPFTGLNAPLYPSQRDQGMFAYLNINYTAYNLHLHGLDRSKIVIGLPTYGHSFRLVSPFNHHIHSPASGNGRLGTLGFITYSEVCWFKLNNFYVNSVYDESSCSPYVYSVFEWISYEDDRSIECKSHWIKEQRFGGAMIFSLNSDDFNLYCLADGASTSSTGEDFKFPLTRKVRQVLNP